MEQTRETQEKDVLLILTQCTYQSSKHKVTEEVHYQISRRISQVATTGLSVQPNESKTNPKCVRRGPIELSTVSNGSTRCRVAPLIVL
jgi:hypothetical protein